MTIKKLSDHKITFGKWKDVKLNKIPLKYLDWLIKQEWMGFKYTEDTIAIKKYLKDPTITKELKKILDKYE